MLKKLIASLLRLNSVSIPIPRLGESTDKTGKTFKQIVISDEPDHGLFRVIKSLLVWKMGARVVNRLDGLDQRYWDFEKDGVVIVLHSEHYLGISIFPAELSNASQKDVDLVMEIFEFLKTVAKGNKQRGR
jgi:hypothetical protein